jgi:hypothetical protein
LRFHESLLFRPDLSFVFRFSDLRYSPRRLP